MWWLLYTEKTITIIKYTQAPIKSKLENRNISNKTLPNIKILQNIFIAFID